MKYYLGIDSGGTKTEFLLADENGSIVNRSRVGASHYQQVGLGGLTESLRVGIEELLRTSDTDPRDIRSACLGLAAYDEIKADLENLHTAVEQGFMGIKHTIAGDNQCAWAGSLGGKSGCNIVAGTGSIAYARDDNGNSARCGGWGHWFGGDEGSAYWIGCQLILAFTRQSDRREERTLLYEAARGHYHINDDFDIVNLVVNRWGMDRSKVATLSRFAFELAEQGDPCCKNIFRDAGRHLAATVNACIAQVPFEGKVSVSYSGGVFNSGEIILRSLRRNLCKEAVLEAPLFEPSIGAILLAMQAVKKPITEDVLKNLGSVGR